MPTVHLDTADAIELAELLQLPHDWVATDQDRLRESLREFVESRPYDVGQLRVDPSPFTSLLGDSDGEVLFGHESEKRLGFHDRPPVRLSWTAISERTRGLC